MTETQEQTLPRLVPELTPELIAESNENQALWRSKVAVPDFLKDKDLNRIFTRKTELAELIQVLRSLPLGLVERRRFFGEQIAEIYAENGQFLKALEFCPPGSRAMLYSAYVRAESLDDADECEHYAGFFVNQGKRVENIYVERRNVPSDRYGKPVPILRCNECGHRNMRPFRDGEEARFRM